MYSIKNYLKPNLLPSERSTLRQLSLTTGRSAQHSRAGLACDGSLSVREHGGDVQTAWAFNIQEVGSWALD